MTVLDQANYILADEHPARQSYSGLPRQRITSQKKKKSTHVQEMAIAALFLGTIIAAVFALCQYQLAENTGVLVHASPVGAEVTIEDRSGCVIKTGFIDDKGELKLTGLRPGSYEVSISHVGFQTATQDLHVLANKTLAIGIPQTLELDPEEKTTSESAVIPKSSIEPSEPPAISKAPDASSVEASSLPSPSPDPASSSSQVQAQAQPALATSAIAAPAGGQVQAAANPPASSSNLMPASFTGAPPVALPFRWAKFGRRRPNFNSF